MIDVGGTISQIDQNDGCTEQITESEAALIAKAKHRFDEKNLDEVL